MECLLVFIGIVGIILAGADTNYISINALGVLMFTVSVLIGWVYK